MSQIVPTITAENPHVYREQIERVQSFAKRVHIDLMDGNFTKNQSVQPPQVWWPEGIEADIHLMFQNPEEVLDQLIKLKPRLVILQAESDGDLPALAAKLNTANIQCGISLLPGTSVESVKSVIGVVQHLLIFSGNLGHQGGSTADLALLDKISEIHKINTTIEIAWDGGVNDTNVQAIARAGVEVINVGGYIQTAPDAKLAYKTLSELLPQTA